MSCAEYWESQGIDPLEAAMTVGCRGSDAVGVINGHDWIGMAIFLGLIAVALCFAKANEHT